MRKSLLCLICWMLLGCAGSRDGANYAWVAPFEEDPSGIRYLRADGYQHFFSYARMTLFAGYTGERLREHIRAGADTLGSSWPMRDCSDERFSCLRAGHFVFAIPHNGLSRGMSYSAEGQRFDVVGCRDDACGVADIRATCERYENQACVLASGSLADASVHAYFTFDRARGVTAIEFGAGATGDVARRSILSGERGILGLR